MTARAQDAAVQIARISPALPVPSCRRSQHVQRPASSHIPPHASRPKRRSVPDVASRHCGLRSAGLPNIAPPESSWCDSTVTEPKEIDLEAIAYHVGADVRRQPLDGCEARIIGYGDRAIITINARSSHRRNRFSIAHELGHWRHHRGQCLVCRAEEVGPREAMSPERIADNYASDLLLPHDLFRPFIRQHPKLAWAT